MTRYITIKGQEEGNEDRDRHNMSKPCLEVSSARTMLECHSSQFEHLPHCEDGKVESARTKLALARIVTL
jgi:hypothetical protein